MATLGYLELRPGEGTSSRTRTATPSRACRPATSGDSVTNARRPRPRVFLERTGRGPRQCHRPGPDAHAARTVQLRLCRAAAHYARKNSARGYEEPGPSASPVSRALA